ncbi:MAG: TIGR00180 family glycosyltransferase [Candidatus Omnitrophica bacterium]|nr:TIGR00180 family glycosyltransferase [Candidatus Omnitrophota bacterium]
MSEWLTLCVPTINRPAFLGRLLRYYAAASAPYRIAIADSSDPVRAEQNQQIIRRLAGRLHVVYRQYPGMSVGACFEAMNQTLDTPYCALLGDDDFLCPPGLERCVEFLEGHPDYGAAHGIGLHFQTEGGHPHGPIGRVGPYPQAVLETDTGAQRLGEFVMKSLYVLIYSVHRAAIWRSMFTGVGAMEDIKTQNGFKNEVLATCVSAVRGKVKALDGLYLFRQVHQRNTPVPHVYEWLTDPEWFPSYRIFEDRVSEELMRQDQLPMEQARQIVRDVFWSYLAKVMMGVREKELRRPSRQGTLSSLRRAARAIPWLRRSGRAARSMFDRYQRPWSLSALLHPSSPYHTDFMAVARAVEDLRQTVEQPSGEAVAV